MGSSFVPLHNYSRAQIFLLYFFFVSNTIMTAYEKDIYAISSSSTIFAAISLLSVENFKFSILIAQHLETI